MPRRSRVASSACVSCPATRISPAVGSSRRLISLSVVVLPDPLRPSSTSVSPAATPKDTSATSTRPSGRTYRPPPARGPRPRRAGQRHQEPAIVARALPPHGEPHVPENPEQGLRSVLVGVAHGEALARVEAQLFSPHQRCDGAPGTEVLGDDVETREACVVSGLEHQLA